MRDITGCRFCRASLTGLVSIFLVVLSTCILQSCSTTRVVTKYDSDTFVHNPLNKRTTWSFAWGLVQPKDIDPGCDSRFNHLDQVTVKTNMGFMLLSVVTLGIVIPQRVEWACAPLEIKTDTLGVNH